MAGIEVVGETPDLDQLRKAAGHLRPDAVMASIALLAPLWSEPAAQWRDAGIQQPLLVAMPEVHDAYLAVAAWAGAGGYVLEDASPADLAEALRRVAARQEGWSGEDRLRALRWQEKVGQPWRSLTHRERDVLRVLARGMSNAAIADATTLTPKTVEHHVSRILDKLGLASRTQAVVWYLEEFPPNLRGGGATPR
ncbi:MAG TPA: response regulator transcription factor [Anaerolineae bacterium]|nr:response regulator transcription factor [Anaerolineae bacterium]